MRRWVSRVGTMNMDTYELFFGNLPDKEKLKLTLQKLLSNIAKIKTIPMEERHYD